MPYYLHYPDTHSFPSLSGRLDDLYNFETQAALAGQVGLVSMKYLLIVFFNLHFRPSDDLVAGGNLQVLSGQVNLCFFFVAAIS